MRKMKSKKGFTLIEMLIVVGIIGILVAVSIPMVNSSLEKARVATDLANERSAKSAALVIYMTGDITTSDAGKVSGEATAKEISVTTSGSKPSTYPCYYDAVQGVIKKNSTTGTGYGKCADHKDKFIQVAVDQNTGEVYLDWGNAAGSALAKKVHLTGEGYDAAAGS